MTAESEATIARLEIMAEQQQADANKQRRADAATIAALREEIGA